MKYKRILTIAGTAVSSVTFAAFGIFQIFQTQVKAFNPQPDPPRLGMLGITDGQTIRISVVNTVIPQIKQSSNPCRVVLTFRNAEGAIFRDGRGSEISRTEFLAAGRSFYLDLNADDFTKEMRGGRLQLRPVIQIQQADGSRTQSPDPCIPTAEVINNANHRTEFMVISPSEVKNAAREQ